MLVESRSPSGLLVMQEGADYRSVLSALRAHDPDLRLVPQPCEGGTRWMVLRYQGSDRPADPVCSWVDDDLEPLPLSHGLVEKVKQLDRNTRGRIEDPDVANKRRLERLQADEDDMIDTAAREFHRRARTAPCFHRGVHLRRGDRLGRL